MFAKLFTTKHGQLLLQKFEDDSNGEYHYGLKTMFDTPSPIAGATCIVTRTGLFGDTDKGEENRDRTFANFEQKDADEMAEQGFS